MLDEEVDELCPTKAALENFHGNLIKVSQRHYF
jgi:hypothetical protein